MEKQTEKDMNEIVNVYRQVKTMFEDIVGYLKLLIMISTIGIWVYIVVIISDFLNMLKIIPEVVIALVGVILFAGGTLAIILKLKSL